MFTGIVEEVGVLERISPGQGGGRTLVIRSGFDPASLALGDSVAVLGVCLTITHLRGSQFSVDAGPETLARTTIGGLRSGSRVNLERALTLATRLGGHLVQGHVDDVGTLESIAVRENARDLQIAAAPDVLRFVAARGAITIDGISLTVTDVDTRGFRVSIIPHTWRITAMADRREGDRVNLEVDLFARYVGRILETQKASSPTSRLTEAFLREHGF